MKVMEKRSYRQFCAIARALDLVGERWTLLLIRELLAGPRRFSDLLEGLPGIGTNLLTTRLRELQAAGAIARSMLPPPASSAVYSLTPRGLRLRSVVMNLGAWGNELLSVPSATETMRPWWSLLLLNGRFYRGTANVPPDLKESYELQCDGEIWHVAIDAGKLSMGQGAARDPAFTVKVDGESLASVIAGTTSFNKAVDRGKVAIVGDMKALKRAAKIFDLSLDGARSAYARH